jgi:hypothetical protein
MASSYTSSLGFEKPATGEQAGTWGATVSNTYDQLEQALAGIEQVTLGAAGDSGSPNEVKITNISDRTELSDGRNLYIEFIDGGDLGATAYVQFTPNTSKKIGYVKNSLSGSQNLILFQGTYNAARDLEVANGTVALITVDGGGAGAANVAQISLSGTGGSGTAIEDGDFTSNGLMTRTASGTYTSRTLTAGTTAGGITVTNGNGVSGNPTVDLDYTLSTSAPSGTPAKGRCWFRYTP